jgi:hypothetical protein
VHEVFEVCFQCLKQTSILNVYNLHGKIFIFNLIFILKIENLEILTYIFVAFLVLVFHESCFVMVFDGCTCGQKNLPNFFCFVIDIYEFFLHMVHEKNVKIHIQATRCQHFWNNYLGEKCNIYMHIFTNIPL